ncbi:hypothetical protein F5Y04DRAFT_282080 [Hypomontagnella monticulosa]|nr:hypothetical protein F5Y04DRAFT_282080 [Hypomontagnella monticulosa]
MDFFAKLKYTPGAHQRPLFASKYFPYHSLLDNSSEDTVLAYVKGHIKAHIQHGTTTTQMWVDILDATKEMEGKPNQVRYLDYLRLVRKTLSLVIADDLREKHLFSPLPSLPLLPPSPASSTGSDTLVKSEPKSPAPSVAVPPMAFKAASPVSTLAPVPPPTSGSLSSTKSKEDSMDPHAAEFVSLAALFRDRCAKAGIKISASKKD